MLLFTLCISRSYSHDSLVRSLFPLFAQREMDVWCSHFGLRRGQFCDAVVCLDNLSASRGKAIGRCDGAVVTLLVLSDRILLSCSLSNGSLLPSLFPSSLPSLPPLISTPPPSLPPSPFPYPYHYPFPPSSAHSYDIYSSLLMHINPPHLTLPSRLHSPPPLLS